MATRDPENAFFIHRRTTLTPLLFPSPKHRRFVIHDECERHVGFGVPTHRRRVFIVASLHGDPRDVLLSQTARCAGECATTGGLCYACFQVEPEGGEPSEAMVDEMHEMLIREASALYYRWRVAAGYAGVDIAILGR